MGEVLSPIIMNYSMDYKLYNNKVKTRTPLKKILGLFSRLYIYIYNEIVRVIAIRRGAHIGSNTILPYKLAKKANQNLTIREDTIVETTSIDLRAPVNIGSHCILNKGVSIIRVSHIIDNNTEFTSQPYPELVIEDYCWLATGSVILPSVTKLEKGTVLGAYSINSKNTETMGVYAGNPSRLVRRHNTLFSDLIVCSLKAGDLKYYINALRK